MPSPSRRVCRRRVAGALVALIALLSVGGCRAFARREVGVPASLPVASATRQVVLVTTPDWQATDATVQLLERDDAGGPWRRHGLPIAASVGRAGFGWGLGEHRGDALAGPTKREGDGRAPAGVFRFGWVFGYDAAAPAGVRMAYRAATARDYFVDDPDSADYNHWRRIPASEPDRPGARWASFERMRRDDGLYRFGAVVEHNVAPSVSGRGSAIFLHIERGPGQPTSGCTAMAEVDLLRLLRWLRPSAAPRLVQAPITELAQLR